MRSFPICLLGLLCVLPARCLGETFLIRDGQVVARQAGLMNSKQIVSFVRQALGPASGAGAPH